MRLLLLRMRTSTNPPLVTFSRRHLASRRSADHLLRALWLCLLVHSLLPFTLALVLPGVPCMLHALK